MSRSRKTSSARATDVHISLHEIVDAIGLPAALDLVRAFGGLRIYLPHPDRVGPENPIAKVIGVERMLRLAAAWPMEQLSVPLAAEHLRRERNRAMRADYRKMSAAQVARKYGTHERNVYRIAACDDDDVSDDQQELF